MKKKLISFKLKAKINNNKTKKNGDPYNSLNVLNNQVISLRDLICNMSLFELIEWDSRKLSDIFAKLDIVLAKGFVNIFLFYFFFVVFIIEFKWNQFILLQLNEKKHTQLSKRNTYKILKKPNKYSSVL